MSNIFEIHRATLFFVSVTCAKILRPHNALFLLYPVWFYVNNFRISEVSNHWLAKVCCTWAPTLQCVATCCSVLQYIAALRPADISARRANTFKQARIDKARSIVFVLSFWNPHFVAQHHRNWCRLWPPKEQQNNRTIEQEQQNNWTIKNRTTEQ